MENEEQNEMGEVEQEEGQNGGLMRRPDERSVCLMKWIHP